MYNSFNMYQCTVAQVTEFAIRNRVLMHIKKKEIGYRLGH